MRSTPMASKQFLSVEDQGEKNVLHLDEEVVRSYLLSDEVADKPVVVISVAGAFRTGKSFLLNSMARYLEASDKSCWLDNKSESFPWKSGCDAHTNGMSMSYPVPVTLQSGEEVALLLMDTQGIFDSNATTADSTRIFALSTLLSSVQVFNLMHNLKSDDLNNLQFFAEYGRLATDSTDGKPFQELLFLIRDWPHAHQHPLGSQGGNALVEKRLSGEKGSLAQRRQHIKACFAVVSGFLLPPPGKVVAGSPTFAGDAEDMDPEFITALDDLVSTLLSPEKLSVKVNGSCPMTCRQLATLIKTYTDLFRSEELPDAQGILEAVAGANNAAAVNDELHTYMKRMQGMLGEDAPMLHEKLLHDEQEQAKAEALKSLELRKTMKDPTKSKDHYSRLLSDKVEDWFKTSQNLFTEKCKQDKLKAVEANKRLVDECLCSFDKSMNSVKSDEPIGEVKIRQSYETAEQVASQRFNREVVTFGSYSAGESRARLERTLKEKLTMILERDEENANTMTVQNEFLRYKTRMNGLLSGNAQALDEALLFDEQAKAKAEVLEALKSMLTMVNSTKPEEYYCCMLADKIEGWFETSQSLFTEKCKRDKLRALEANKRLVDECLSSFDRYMDSVKSDKSIGENKIRKSYGTAKQVAFHRFNAEVLTFGSYSAEESRSRLEETLEEKLTMILGRDEENANAAAVRNQFLRYRARMEDLLGEDALLLDECLLFDEHTKAKAETLNALKPQLTMSSPTKQKNHYSHLLVNSIEDWFKTSQNLFKEKCKRDKLKANEANKKLVQECISSFEKSMESVCSDQSIDGKLINEVYETAKNKALELFRMKKLTCGSYTGEENLLKLTVTLEKRLCKALERNDEILRNMTVVEDEFATYEKRMKTLLSKNAPMLDKSMLCDEHFEARRVALKSLEQRQTHRDPNTPANRYSCLLVDKIEGWFRRSETLFNEKCEKDRLNADQANETLEDECCSSFNESLNSLNKDHLKNETQVDNAIFKARHEALQLFESKVVTFGSYSAEDSRTRLDETLKVSSLSWRIYYMDHRNSISTKLKAAAGACLELGCAVGDSVIGYPSRIHDMFLL